MKKLIVILLAACMITALAACNQKDAGTSQATAEEVKTIADISAQSTSSQPEAAQTAQNNNAGTATTLKQGDEVVTTANVTSNGALDATDFFSERDLKQTADLTDATEYQLSDGSSITIDKAGVYVITGSAENASVIVDAGDDDKVQLVLNGVTVSNSSAPAIYVKNADKVFVTTAEGTTNSLSVTGSFTADGNTNTDAVIFSKDDLVINGLGTLTINSSDNGISGKDDIKITGGTINITCTSDAIEAKDSIRVADGNLTIKAGKDGLHAENDEDNTVGYIYICGGTFNITAGSDGIQGTTIVQIDGGSLTMTSSEGVEATFVQINGGTVSIDASDDGVNASNKSSACQVKIEVNGGDITVNMGQGDTDGFDTNGDLIINGGTLNVNAQSPFDYDGQGQLNGGTVYVNGSQTTELTNQMMGGGPGGMGGHGDMGGPGNMPR